MRCNVFDDMIENNMLGKDGLTITSANHLANIAKEMYESLVNRVESLKLVSRDYMIAVNGNVYRVESESDKSELDSLSDNLKEIGLLKSLIAYLREGIAAKNELSKDSAFEKHLESLIAAGRVDLKEPEGMRSVEFEDVFEKQSAEQKAKYYSLEAMCAAFGKCIHLGGTFSEARKLFYETRKNPTKVTGKGQEAEINDYSSAFTTQEVDDTFFSLQREYRKLQAELNRLKSEIDTKVDETNLGISNDNLTALKSWREAKKVERIKYNEMVRNLKVVIPENLREIYAKVNEVASQK